jgi:hypothetical protein
MALRKQTRAQKLPRAGFIARNRFWGAHELNYLILHQSWTDLKWWVDGRLFHQLHTHKTIQLSKQGNTGTQRLLCAGTASALCNLIERQ